MKFINKKIILPTIVMTIAGLALVAPAFALTTGPNGNAYGFYREAGMGMMGRGIVGTVASVSGNTLTVTSKQWTKPASGATDTTGAPTQTTVTYTVDATNATVTKNGAASSVSGIAVNDTVMIQGTISGENVTAKTIRDGVMQRPTGAGQDQNGKGQKQPTILNPGNGQPVVAGSVVTNDNSSVITITNKSGVSYTINTTSSTKIQKGQSNVTISSVSVGDNLIVQGTVSGNIVTASTILDQGATPAASATGTTKPQSHGFFGMIGNFFSKLFGF